MAEVAEISPLVGQSLGKYRILGRIAAGGMAELFVAEASGIEGFRKLVAIKRILPEHTTNASFVRMFLNEARLAATLHHPNIAQVYDIEADEHGGYFIAMEYVHGQSVLSLLRRADLLDEALSVELAATIAYGVCGALYHAHRMVDAEGRPLGIIHRDVSPSNILVTYEGVVKLVDFGIAKARTDESHTRAGTIKGKLSYMSPEQCLGDALDARSDIFSLGIVLWEMLSGRMLFRGEGPHETGQRLLSMEIPRVSQFRPVGDEMEYIVARCLERDVRRRFESAREVQMALEEASRISPLRVASEMERLFDDELHAWMAAQEDGATLGEHVLRETRTHSVASESLPATVATAPVARPSPQPPQSQSPRQLPLEPGFDEPLGPSTEPTAPVARASKQPSLWNAAATPRSAPAASPMIAPPSPTSSTERVGRAKRARGSLRVIGLAAFVVGLTLAIVAFLLVRATVPRQVAPAAPASVPLGSAGSDAAPMPSESIDAGISDAALPMDGSPSPEPDAAEGMRRRRRPPRSPNTEDEPLSERESAGDEEPAPPDPRNDPDSPFL